jgi:hypothetical protein
MSQCQITRVLIIESTDDIVIVVEGTEDEFSDAIIRTFLFD